MKKTLLITLALSVLTICRTQDSLGFFSLISSHNDISLERGHVIPLPTLGAYLAIGNRLYALDEECEMKTISFPDDLPVDDIIWNDDDFIIKSKNRVFDFNNIESPRIEFETSDFKIFPCEKEKIYVVSKSVELSHLYMANLKLKKIQRMVNLQGEVLNVAKRGVFTWVTTNECVYRFDKDSCEVMFLFKEPVNSVVMTEVGLLFATNKSINILADKNRYITLLKGDNHGILYDGEWLYIITNEYDLVRFYKSYINAILMMMEALLEDELE